MKIRTCLLAAFGLVVPLIAMFSHLIPAGVSESLWNLAWQPAAAFFDDAGSASDGLSLAEGEPAAEPETQEAADSTAALLSPDVSIDGIPLPGAAAGGGLNGTAGVAGPGGPQGGPGVVLPTITISGAPTSPDATQATAWPTATVRRPPGDVEPAAVAAGSDATNGFVTPTALARAQAPPEPADPATIAALTELGAYGIACQPTAGGRFFHCSCRVAADPTGQLVRMFHATETEPQRAMLRLVDDIRRWQAQIAGVAADGPTTGSPLPFGEAP